MHRILGMLGGLLLSLPAGAAELQLVAIHEGQRLPVVGVENHRIMAQSGTQRVALERDTRFELDGDLLANAALVEWSPGYGIRRGGAVKDQPPGVLLAGRLGIRHLTELSGRKVPSDFVARWSGGAPEGGIIIMAWLVDGRISQLGVKKVPSTKVTKFFVASRDFVLSPAEAAGQGIMLFWAQGRFVPPAPRFKDSRAQQALAGIMLRNLAPLQEALTAGLKPSAKGTGGETLLHFAAEAGAVEAVDLLLKRGAAPAAATNFGATPLHWAAAMGRQGTAARLLQEKVAANATTEGGNTALHSALEAGHAAVAQLLIDRTSGLDAPNEDLRSPYSLAIDLGEAGLARLMRARGAGGRPDQEALQRVLLTQAEKGNTEMVRFLAEQKISANFEMAGNRPLNAAAALGTAEMAGVLLRSGATVNETNDQGLTAVMVASGRGNREYALALLEAGADVNLRAKDGKTALHFAAAGNNAALVELLLSRGADPRGRDQDGLSALDLALASSARVAARVLDAAGASVDPQSRHVAALMEAAVKLNLSGVVERALAAGWPATTTFRDEWPALLVAETCKAAECAALLRKAGAGPVPGQPVVVPSGSLDQVPRLAAAPALADPRDPDGTFPATVVEVDVVIDSKGRVLFPIVKSDSEWFIAHAGVQSLAAWRFTPVTSQNRPVAVRLLLPIEFPASADLAIRPQQADVMPLPLKQVSPVYPGELINASRQASVTLTFTVGLDGRPANLRILRTSGPEFNQPAMAAVSKWIFKPGEAEGRPVPVRLQQEIVFTLQ